MSESVRRRLRRRSHQVLLLGAIPFALLTSAGCGVFTLPLSLNGLDGLVGGSTVTEASLIAASVTATSAETGLPTTLSGVVSGLYEGTYQEEILEVFFDASGAPIAALSRSVFTLTEPREGTLTTLNLIIVSANILLTDATGAPVLDANGLPTVIGLQTSSAGDIIHGTGMYDGATGQIHSDTTLLLTGGDAAMGSVESDLTVNLELSTAG